MPHGDGGAHQGGPAARGLSGLQIQTNLVSAQIPDAEYS
jgi:hypothetical protein